MDTDRHVVAQISMITVKAVRILLCATLLIPIMMKIWFVYFVYKQKC